MKSLGMLMLVAVAATAGTVTKKPYGKMPDGKAVDLYTLRNAKGMEVDVITYGGVVTSVRVPDRTGKIGDVVLGFDSLDGYRNGVRYMGALIGRYGNRIGKGTFTLDGKTYTLAKNNGPNALHGGGKAFDNVVWSAKESTAGDGAGIELTHSSPDGEEGYPGNLSVKVIYSLSDANELVIQYSATTDKPTIVNLTNHSYFNLAGKGDILGHVVTLQADKFTPVDATLIPTGEIRTVKGTPFDFTTPHKIGERISAADEQIKFGNGYDHNFVISAKGSGRRLFARVSEPGSGRVMEVLTTEPGVQFYTGNFLNGMHKGKGGVPIVFRAGLCLETQHFPDSPNKKNFPSTVLKPGQTYRSETVYRFSVEK
jgi:aldose 1-epimerase